MAAVVSGSAGRAERRLPPATIPGLRRHPAIPYVLPFAVFIGMLALQQWVSIPAWVRFAVLIVAIIAVSMVPLRGGPSKPLASILIGVAVFVVWVAPDVIAPWWHHI